MRAPVALTPDVTVWVHLGDWLNLLGGAQAVALQTALVALLLGVCAWALGAAAGVDRLASAGKFCTLGAMVAAFVTPMLGPWVGWLITTLS